ncbi:hypothetical protein FLACOL7796_04724 [Flavobacterium collinsii]|uniref:Uncharacterized protein n=1 Tax=Flavobacterium collinsii TaxID=1114861 RepID=A0ABM8KSM6_9FLAO|nr:hypothetical protein FLACOL7796_04724 [Flavobacterium collinsii]
MSMLFDTLSKSIGLYIVVIKSFAMLKFLASSKPFPDEFAKIPSAFGKVFLIRNVFILQCNDAPTYCALGFDLSLINVLTLLPKIFDIKFT